MHFSAAPWIWILLTAAALVCTAALLRSRWERGQLETVKYSFRWSRAGGLFKAEPAGFKAEAAVSDAKETDTCRFVFLSDLHDYCRDYGDGALLSEIMQCRPDFVLLGGDMITCRKETKWKAETEASRAFIEKLAENCPVFYGEGNHEARLQESIPEIWENYRKALEKAGVIFLKDRAVLFNGLSICGVSLDEIYYNRMFPGFGRKTPLPGDYLMKKLGMPAAEHMNILLLHSPMYLREAAAWGADLVLSGHFHGGTIRLPLPGEPGLMTPQFQFLVKECSGMHSVLTGDDDGSGRRRGPHRQAMMISNRGLGTHSINIRLRDLPEISLVEIEKCQIPAAAGREKE